MSIRTLTSALLVFTAAVLIGGTPVRAGGFTEPQKREIEKTVHDYLMANPEILVDVMKELDKKRTAAAEEDQKTALATLDKDVAAPMVPKTGNPKGNVTVVEFFDYECGFCKKVFPHLKKILAEDHNIRMVNIEFPILTPESVVGARAALAIWKMAPGKYAAFHNQLMEMRGRLSTNKIMATAKDLGIDTAALKKAMADPSIDAALNANMELARKLNITGTPGFVIGNQIFPGYLNEAQLKKQIAAARDEKG